MLVMVLDGKFHKTYESGSLGKVPQTKKIIIISKKFKNNYDNSSELFRMDWLLDKTRYISKETVEFAFPPPLCNQNL